LDIHPTLKIEYKKLILPPVNIHPSTLDIHPAEKIPKKIFDFFPDLRYTYLIIGTTRVPEKQKTRR